MPILKEGDQKIKGFWVKWLQSDEIDQLRLIESLMMPSNVIKDKKLHNYHCASIFNHYLEDIVKVLAHIPPEELAAYLEPWKINL